jgi:AcrR family transcriptional regulator
MGRPRIHDERTRQTLLRIAEAMVAEGGIEALSVRRVAEVGETTTRAVYSVFGGKRGLVQALYRDAWNALRLRVIALPATEDPVEGALRCGLVAFREFARDRPHLFRLAFEGRLPIAPTRDDLADAILVREELWRHFRRCADAGLLATPAELAARQFHAFCVGLASNELNGWLAMYPDAAAVWESALRALLRGMAPASPSERPADPPEPRGAGAKTLRRSPAGEPDDGRPPRGPSPEPARGGAVDPSHATGSAERSGARSVIGVRSVRRSCSGP